MNEVIRTMMRPMVKLLLRHGVAFATFSSIVRKLYVDVAESDFRIEGRKQTASRISVLTGITRREVKTLLDYKEDTPPNPQQYNSAARLFFGWLQDEDYLDSNGRPLPLTIDGPGPATFTKLVKKYCADNPVRAVQDEVLRIGAVSRNGDLLILNSTGYVPTTSDELLEVSSLAVADLLNTIDHNNQSKTPEDTRLQLSVSYDNVSTEAADIFRILSREKSKELLLYLDRFLAKHDRDANPELEGQGTVRTGLGIFYFEETKDEIIASPEDENYE